MSSQREKFTLDRHMRSSCLNVPDKGENSLCAKKRKTDVSCLSTTQDGWGRPTRKVAELSESLTLLDLLLPERLHALPQLIAVLNEHVPMDLEENGQEGLDGLEVLVRLEPLGEGDDERVQVVKRDERRAELEVGRRRRERLEVGKESLDCRR